MKQGICAEAAELDALEIRRLPPAVAGSTQCWMLEVELDYRINCTGAWQTVECLVGGHGLVPTGPFPDLTEAASAEFAAFLINGLGRYCSKPCPCSRKHPIFLPRPGSEGRLVCDGTEIHWGIAATEPNYDHLYTQLNSDNDRCPPPVSIAIPWLIAALELLEDTIDCCGLIIN